MINKVILLGNVGADPEIHTFESGSKTARLRLATTERTYNKETREATTFTEWHTVNFWGSLADVVDSYVHKGSQLYIEGSIRTREWNDKSGNKRYSVEINGQVLKLLGPKPSEGAHNSAAQTYTPQPTGGVPETPVAVADDIDDLPF